MNILACSFLAVLTLLFTAPVFADQPYDGEVFLSDEGRSYSVMHVHSRQSKPEGLHAWYGSMVKNFEECDHTNGHQGILQIFKGNQRIYCTAPPALTHLWLSPDEKYIVGLSTIYARNSHQLVVYSVEGELIYRKAIECDELSSFCVPTNSEYIYWFHELHPAINLEQLESGKLRLTLQDKHKKRFSIMFPQKPATPLDKNACGRNREPKQIESYWLYHIQGRMHVLEKHEDIVCIYYQSGNRARAYYYIPRDDYENRNIKEKSYRDFLSFNVEHLKQYPKYGEDYFLHDVPDLARVTGLNFETAEDFIKWWNENENNLVLSEDGRYLVLKN